MRKTFFQKVPAYQFHTLQKFSDQLEHAVFSRQGGVSKKPYDSLNVRFTIGDKELNVKKNRAVICDALGLDSEQLVSVDQTHSKNVQMVDEQFLKNYQNVEVSERDALITDKPKVGLMIQVADCQALLFFDPIHKVIAAIHAGWKGLAQDITGQTVKMLKKFYKVDPHRLLVGISPSLGPCCAFFSDPEKELPQEFHPFIDKEKRVDLWAFSVWQLQKHGIAQKNIELAKICTQCGRGGGKGGRGRFFSFRGEHGITGRFGAVIFLR